MSKADLYFREKKWDDARIMWERLFYKKEKSKDIDKARMAMNVGTAYEMADNLIMAVYWVQKAKNIYDKTEATEDEKLKAEEYLASLNSRIRNNKILDRQYE
jgi:hypothetical protein